jgi:hypothetical protein
MYKCHYQNPEISVLITVLSKKGNTYKQEKYKILKSKMRIKRGRYMERERE